MAQTLKTNLAIALATGFLISTVFMSIPSMRDGTSDWSGVEFLGMAAATCSGGRSAILCSGAPSLDGP
jgi:hypothetical protein